MNFKTLKVVHLYLLIRNVYLHQRDIILSIINLKNISKLDARVKKTTFLFNTWAESKVRVRNTEQVILR